MKFARLEVIYSVIMTVVAILAVTSLVSVQQGDQLTSDFDFVRQQAFNLYDDIEDFTREDAGARVTVFIDENTEIDGNFITIVDGNDTDSFLVDTFIQESACQGENELVRLVEGVAICCGQCDDDVRLTFPSSTMCSPRTDLWLECDNYIPGQLGRVATTCDNLQSSVSVFNEDGELLAESTPSAQWEDYMIYDINTFVGVGDYEISISCDSTSVENLLVRRPSSGGGGGGGGSGSRDTGGDSSGGSTNQRPESSFIMSVAQGYAPLFITFNGSLSSDSDGHITSYLWDFGAGGNTTNTSFVNYTYTVPGTYNVSLFVFDNEGKSDEDVQTVLVAPANNAPVLDLIGNQHIDVDMTLAFSLNINDADVNDTISCTTTPLPPGAQFNDSSCTFSWTPNSTQVGNYDVTFIVSDDNILPLSDSEDITITVGDANQPPVLTFIDDIAADENTSIAFTLDFSDPDVNDTVTCSASNLPSDALFDNNTCTFSWNPTFADAGTYAVVFTVTDDGDPIESDQQSVQITIGDVNRPPVLSTIGDRAVNENESISFTLSATDPDNDRVRCSASNLPTGATFNTLTCTFDWEPDFGASGVYADIQFTVTDGGIPPLSDGEAISITVGNVNRAPVLDAIGNQAVDEDEELSFAITGSDPDGDDVSCSASNLPTGASFDTTTCTFSWTPNFGSSGTYADVLFTLTDDDALPLSDSELISITVGNVNRPPVLDAIGNQAVDEDEELSFVITGNDPDGDDLSCSAGNLPSGASFDTATCTFSWTPGFGDSGVYTNVVFTITDDDTLPLSDSELVSITVGNVNRPPVLDAIGNQAVDEDEELSFVITGSDSDGDDVTCSASNLPTGASFDTTTCTFSWTPGFGDSGNYNNVRFTLTDDGAPTLTDSEDITITVGDVNRAPVLSTIGDRNVDEGDLLSFVLSYSDPDGDDVSCSASNLPSGSSFDTTTCTFSWTPTFADVGTYNNIQFTIIDDAPLPLSDSESISVTVNDLPQCSDGIDNDGDGEIDFGEDDGCNSVNDNDETDPVYACSDGLDNDGDTLIDFPNDPGCSSPQDITEQDDIVVGDEICDDGIDNDFDEATDYEDNDCYVAGTIIYVSDSFGDDSWNGLSGVYQSGVTGPVKSVERAQELLDTLGDSGKLLFYRGDTFHSDGQTTNMISLTVKRGTEENPFTVSAYGFGARPILGHNASGAIISIYSGDLFDDTSEHILIQGLELTTIAPIGNRSLAIRTRSKFDGVGANPDTPGWIAIADDSTEESVFFAHDYCIDANTLVEYACTNNEVLVGGVPTNSVLTVNCAGDCVDGRCLVDAIDQCGDGLDNDGDGLIDFGSDDGCSSVSDNSELIVGESQCSDGIDNDGDGRIDRVSGNADPQCQNAQDNSEGETYACAESDSGFQYSGYGRYYTFDDLYIHDNRYGLDVQGAHDVTISNSYLADNYGLGSEGGHTQGAFISAGENIYVINNTWKTNGRPTSGFDHNIYLSNLKSGRVINNTFLDSLSSLKIRKGSNVLVEDNHFYNVSSSIIAGGDGEGDYDEYPGNLTNVTIRNNLFEYMLVGISLTPQSTGVGYTNDLYIYNNIFKNGKPQYDAEAATYHGVIHLGSYLRSVSIFNNLIYNHSRDDTKGRTSLGIYGSNGMSSINIHNNVYWEPELDDADKLLQIDSDTIDLSDNITFSNEHYFGPNGTVLFSVRSIQDYQTFDEFTSAYPEWTSNAQFGNPLFEDELAGLFTPTVGSPLIDTGYAVGSYLDLNDVSRPQDGNNDSIATWDRGPFEVSNLGGGGSGDDSFSLSFIPSQTTCTAPCGVHFDATPTTVAGVEDPFVEVRYDWNFDNPSSNHIHMTEFDANTFRGPLAAHVFTQPGTYDVSVTATLDDGTQETVTRSIIVQDPDVVFAGKTYCVSTTNDYADCPTQDGAFHLTSLDTATQGLIFSTSDDRRLLLHAGETFQHDGWGFNSNGFEGYSRMIASYGSGAMPIINLTGNSAFMQLRYGDGIVITNIDLRGQYNSSTGLGAHATGVYFFGDVFNSTLYNNRFSGLGLTIYPRGDGGTASNVFADNYITNWQDYGFFGSLNRTAIIGNKIEQAPTTISGDDSKCHLNCVVNFADHGPIRTGKVDHSLITRNSMSSRNGWSSSGLGIQSNLRFGTMGFIAESVVSDNVMENGFGVMGSALHNNNLNTTYTHYIVERNKLIALRPSLGFISVDGAGLTFRNNLMIKPDNADILVWGRLGSSLTSQGIELAVNNLVGDAGLTPVNIYGNTLVYYDQRQSNPLFTFLRIRDAGLSEVNMHNNIVYAPNFDASSNRGPLLFEQVVDDPGLTFTADNNLFYTNGFNQNSDVVASVASTEYDLSAWQGQGYEQNSINTDPLLSNLPVRCDAVNLFSTTMTVTAVNEGLRTRLTSQGDDFVALGIYSGSRVTITNAEQGPGSLDCDLANGPDANYDKCRNERIVSVSSSGVMHLAQNLSVGIPSGSSQSLTLDVVGSPSTASRIYLLFGDQYEVGDKVTYSIDGIGRTVTAVGSNGNGNYIEVTPALAEAPTEYDYFCQWSQDTSDYVFNYTLTASSPAIGEGVNTSVLFDDFTQTLRTSLIDLGALQFSGSSITPPSSGSCGDGGFDPGEQCDDGNLLSGDGCSDTCTIESGWSCDNTSFPNVCTEDATIDAQFTALPTSGTSPLTVTFDASATTTNSGSPITYRWDFDNDGTIDYTAASDPSATFTYTSAYPQGVLATLSAELLTGETDTFQVQITVAASSSGGTETLCSDGLDNDNDGAFDDEDSDCSSASTTFYVSSSSGDDSWSGLAPQWNGTDGPVQSLSRANDIIESAPVSAHILYKRDDTWTDNYSLNAIRIRGKQGTADNPFLVGAYGQGAAPIFAAQNNEAGLSLWSIDGGVAQHVLIRDLHFDSYTAPGARPRGVRIYEPTEDQRPHDITFDNIRIENNGYGFSIQNADNITITNSYLKDNYGIPPESGHTQGLYTSKVYNYHFENNTFIRNGKQNSQYDHNNYLSSSYGVLRNNSYLGSNSDLKLRGGGPHYVLNNYFINGSSAITAGTDGGGIFNGVIADGNTFDRKSVGIALVYQSSGNGISTGSIIRNNLFLNREFEVGTYKAYLQVGPEQVDLSIYNNLFYNTIAPDEQPALYMLRPENSSNIRVRNNMFVELSVPTDPAIELNQNMFGVASFDNNLFYVSGGSLFYEVAGTAYALDGALQSAFNQENNVLLVDPRMRDPSSGDYTLATNSPAVDAGENAAGIVDTDFDGITRPQDGNLDALYSWDIGSYELQR